MSSSFDLPEPDRFTTGTVGPPGQRVFYLQGAVGDQVVSLRLEKAQVAALAEYLADLVGELPDEVDAGADDLELVEPVVAEWVVGTIAVAVDEASDRFVVQAEELLADDAEEGSGAVARFVLDRRQVAAFILRAATVVAAGRPPCPLCGRPVGADGHVCVKTNGHKAH